MWFYNYLGKIEEKLVIRQLLQFYKEYGKLSDKSQIIIIRNRR